MAHEAQTRLPWTAEEDAVLIALVERWGEKRWNMVANGLPGRTGKGCSHRWRTYLRPDVKHPHLEPFTEWEAAVIIQAQKEMGNNWLAIAKLLLPGRSNTAVKNFWHCRLKSGTGTNTNKFIVGGHCLAWLLSEVAHEDRIYPVALPAFPSTAPTGQLHPQGKVDTVMMMDAAGALSAQSEEGGMDAAAATQAHMVGVAGAVAATLPGDDSGSGAAGADGGAAATEIGAGLSAEELRRRASAYVQQQLAMFGQPASTRGGGACSTAVATRRDSLSASVSCAAGGGMAGASLGGATWPGLGIGGSISMAASLALAPRRGTGGGAGRGGRGRVRRQRSSCDDDPDDETYVPAGSSLERELARCGGNARTRGAAGSGGGPAGDDMQQQAWTAAAAAAAAAQWSSMAPGYGGDAVSAAAAYEAYATGCLPGALVGAAYHGAQSAALTYVQAHTSSYGGGITAAPGDGQLATAGQPGAGLSGYEAGSNAATVLPASRRGSLAGSPLLGLEEAAVAFEAFRRSGGDFKLSLGCLDDLLGGSGHSGRPSACVPDWTVAGAGSVADGGPRPTGLRVSSGSMHPPRPVVLTSAGTESVTAAGAVGSTECTMGADTGAGHPCQAAVLAAPAGVTSPSNDSAGCSDGGLSVPPAAGGFGSFVQPAATPGVALPLAPALQQQQQQQQQSLAMPGASGKALAQGAGALGSPAGARLPSTFHSVLQALLPTGGGAKLAAAAAAQQQGKQAQQLAPGLPPVPAPQACSGIAEADPVSCARKHGSSAGRASRRSSALALFSPGPGSFLMGEAGALEGLLLAPTPGITDAAFSGLSSSDLHAPQPAAPGDGAQVRAERRSLRVLLGALASCEPAGADVNASMGRVSLSAGAGGGSGSSSRVSLNSLRSSSRGLPGWFGFAASPAAAHGCAGGPDIAVAAAAAALRRTARLSNAAMLSSAAGMCGGIKRQRSSSGLLLSPTGCTGAGKRHRVSSLASTAVLGFAAGGNNAGNGGMDECLSYWRV